MGESGSGKSTLAAILMGRNKHYRGSVTVGGVELSDIREDSLMEHITYIGHQSYLFKGTVRDNLLMGDPAASDDRLWAVLDEVRLTPFLQSENGLNTVSYTHLFRPLRIETSIPSSFKNVNRLTYKNG